MLKQNNLILLVLISLFTVQSCKKDENSKGSLTKSSDKSLSQLTSIQKENLTSLSVPITSTTTIWQNQLLSFYQFSEGRVTKNVADANLQNLGDLLDQNNFTTASALYNIPVDSLKKLKTLYFNAFSYWYYNVRSAPVAKSTLAGGPIANFYDNDCYAVYTACTDNANLDYFGHIAGCYAGAIAAAGFTTPIGGGIFAIGCGLWAGRHRRNDLAICSGDYHNCH